MSGTDVTIAGASGALIGVSLTALVAWLAFTRPRVALYATFALVPTQFIFVPVRDFFLSPADGAALACTAGLVARLVAGEHRAWLAVRLHVMLGFTIAAYLVGFVAADYAARTLIRLPLAIVPSILACELLVERRHVRSALAALLVAGLVDAGFGLYFFALGRPLHPTRFSGMMGLNFSAIAILSAAAIAFTFLARTRNPVKLLLPALLALVGFATLSKMGILAFAVAVGVVTWRLATQPIRRLTAAAAVAILAIAIGHPALRDRVFARTETEAQVDRVHRTSTDVRLLILRSALDGVAEHPFVGIGYFNFQAYSTRDPEILASTGGAGYATHNTYLEVLVEGGLLAFVPFLLHFAQYLPGLRRGWMAVIERRDEVVGAALAALVVVAVSALAANLLLHYFFWSVCGVGLACVQRLRRGDFPESARP